MYIIKKKLLDMKDKTKIKIDNHMGRILKLPKRKFFKFYDIDTVINKFYLK